LPNIGIRVLLVACLMSVMSAATSLYEGEVMAGQFIKPRGATWTKLSPETETQDSRFRLE